MSEPDRDPSLAARRAAPWFVLAAGLLILLAGYTRLTAPWQFGLVVDEMHHLESWRNRYRTDDIYPVGMQKIESTGLLKGQTLERFRELYHGSRLVQRGLIVLVDPQPPTFPVMAEAIEAATHSSLLAARLPSAIASMLAIVFMFKLGRTLRDTSLGVWLGTLLTIGLLAQAYATVARPYALAQFALILTIYLYMREQQAEHRSSWRFLLAALFAQSTQWMVWAVVGPLVALELARRWRGGARLGELFKQTWWYVLLSVAMLPIMLVQLRNPTISQQAGIQPLEETWGYFALASPFAHLDPIVQLPISLAGVLLAVMTLVGAACVLGDRASISAGRAGLIIALLASVLTPIFVGSSERFMMTYAVVPTIVAGIGIRWLLRSEAAAQIGLAAVLALFIGLRLWAPESPYQRVFWDETDYVPIAAQLKQELDPGDVWCAFPYVRANCLYRFGAFPEPVLPLDEAQFEAFLRTLPRAEGDAIVFTRTPIAKAHPVLRTAEKRWRYFNDFVLVVVPAQENVGSKPAIDRRADGVGGERARTPQRALEPATVAARSR